MTDDNTDEQILPDQSLQDSHQRIIINPINEDSIKPDPIKNTVIIPSLPTYQDPNKKIAEDLEKRRCRNETIAINIFIIFALGFNIWLMAETFLLEIASGSGNHFRSFLYSPGILIYLLLLRKSDIARKIFIAFEYVVVALVIIALFSPYGVTVSNFITLVIAIFTIIFFSSRRIKRHF